MNRESSLRDSRDSQRSRIEKLGIGQRQHQRNDSGATGQASSTDYSEPPQARRHDYDVQSMETDLSSPRHLAAKNPIPAPIVTVRSEFPTLSRSRQQQSLTCLVTIEVPEGKWHPDLDDLRHAPPVPPLPQDDGVSVKHRRSPPTPQPEPIYEAPEVLGEVTEELKARVDNWHGLEFQR